MEPAQKPAQQIPRKLISCDPRLDSSRSFCGYPKSGVAVDAVGLGCAPRELVIGVDGVKSIPDAVRALERAPGRGQPEQRATKHVVCGDGVGVQAS